MQIGEQAAWAVETVRGVEAAKNTTFVYFEERPVQNNAKSLQEGRPVFDNVIFIVKIPPGDKYNVVDRKASQQDKLNYPEQWERYQKKLEAKMPGTPLEAWPLLARNQVAELKALNIFVVEQLADLPDSQGSKIMGFQNLKQKAQAFLRATSGIEQESKLKERDDLIAKQGEALKALSEQVAALQANQKKKPGRPKKDALPA